jgi:hypothetical protein
MASPSKSGRNISAAGAFRLALFAVAMLGVVAIAGAMAWWQVFANPWPGSAMRIIEAGGIALGISAQPVISAYLAWGIRPPAGGAL